MRVAYVRHLKNGSIEIHVPFEDEFREELKRRINYPARQWDKEKKLWCIARAHVDIALAITRNFFVVHETYEEQQEQQREERQREEQHRRHQQRNPSGDNLYAELFLIPTAPREVIKAAYRALSLLYHPDHGGSNEAQQKLNAVYERLSK